MSDSGPHHPIAEAMRVAREEAAVRDRLNAPLSGAPSAIGGGVGNATGWAVFFGMIGAVLGGIFGRGLMGAIIGAVMLGGGFALVAWVGRKTSSIWNRGPVFVWVILGAVGGWCLGALMHSDASGWAVAGMMAAGGFRYMMKD